MISAWSLAITAAYILHRTNSFVIRVSTMPNQVGSDRLQYSISERAVLYDVVIRLSLTDRYGYGPGISYPIKIGGFVVNSKHED